MSTETCVVRPELIEFDKTGSIYLSIVANDGFHFTQTGQSTNDQEVNDIPTDSGNLANIFVGTIKATDIIAESITVGGGSGGSMSNLNKIEMQGPNSQINMMGGDISNLGTLETYTSGPHNSVLIFENQIDLNETGNVVRVNEMTFFGADPANVLTFNNDSIVFGASDGLLDLSEGKITQIKTMNMFTNATIDANSATMTDLKTLTMVADTGVVDMNDGTISQVKHLQLSPDATVDASSALMSNLDQLIFSAGVGDNSNISNLNTLNMIDTTGSINMPNGSLEILGSGAVANVGELTLSSHVIQNTLTNKVIVEETEFVDKTITTANVEGFGSDSVRVVDAMFTQSGVADPTGATDHTGVVTVSKIQTDVVEPQTSNVDGGVDIDLILQARGDEGAIKVQRAGGGAEPVRITNVAQPILNSDAVTKSYVTNIMDRNIQGLKPKEACEVAIFGPGYTAHDATDIDPIFTNGTNDDYIISHKQSSTIVEGVSTDTSDMFLFMKPITEDYGNVTLNGQVFSKSDLNASYTRELQQDPTLPSIRKFRVMFNGLDSCGSPDGPANIATYGEKLPVDNTTVGLNGIWEVQEMMTEADLKSIKYNVVRFRRSVDFNQTHEIMNGAYTYVKGGTHHANTGFVVQDSNDPILLSSTTGLTTNKADVVVEIKWVTFNTVNYELDFVNPVGQTKEVIGDATVDFKKGGLAMKFDAEDDKKVMVDATKLRYETDDTVGLGLHVQGNLEFDLTAGHSQIQHTTRPASDETYNIIVNGSTFYSNVASEESFINTTFLSCQAVSCESDIRLKKNIEPITNGLELVSKLNSVTYNWKTDDDSTPVDYGFIAQEIEAIFPALVNTSQTTGYKAVDYMKFVSVLAAGMQELAVTVSKLTTQVASLSEK